MLYEHHSCARFLAQLLKHINNLCFNSYAQLIRRLIRLKLAPLEHERNSD